MRGGTPAGRPESAEEPENRGAEHLFEHWTFDAISHVRFPLLMLTLLSGMIKKTHTKGKGCTSSEDTLYYCFLLPQVKSFICYNLSYFLTLFNCIYVSFLYIYINYLQI